MKKRKILIGLAVLILLLSFVGVNYVLKKMNSQKNHNINSDTISENTINILYNDLKKDCIGAYVWPEQTVEINEDTLIKHCQKENYFTKLFGYSKTSDGVILDLKVIKKKEKQVFKIDGSLIGNYEESDLNDLLDIGTTYRYTYQMDNDTYKVVKVETV